MIQYTQSIYSVMAFNKYFLHLSATSLILTQLLIAGPVRAESPMLVKVKNNPAVYWIKGTTRHPFPLLGVYKSWFGTSFTDVKEIPLSELSSYTLSKNILFKTNSLIKIQTDPKVYRVADESGTLEWIASEEEFKKRGYSFKDVMDVPDAFFPDYTLAQSDDFATPQNGQSQNPTTTSTPSSEPQIQPLPAFGLSNLTVASSKGLNGSQASFSFSTNEPASVTLALVALSEGAVTSTVQFTQDTTFAKTVNVFAGVTYSYTITATNAGGKIATASGSFMSYSDIVVNGLPEVISHKKPLVQPDVLVGAFSVTNKSSEARTAIQFTLRFDSASSVTKNIAKTIQIVRLNGSNAVGDMVVEKTIGSGIAITNLTNLQKFALEEVIAPGETKKFGIVMKNLDQINVDLTSPSETFVPIFAGADFLGETNVALINTTLGTLTYQRPQ